VPSTLAIVGPGKVGQALARRWRESGAGRVVLWARGEARAAVEFTGAQQLAAARDLSAATVVAVTVPDAAIAPVTAALAAQGAVRRCALWLHASGARGLDVLDAARAEGARVGSLHPLCPFPSAALGYRLLPGRVATLSGAPESLRLLTVLARHAQLVPQALGADVDRVLYHAACALAANGATALIAAVERALAPAFAPAAAAACTASLVSGALAASAEVGAVAALTGPAVRGDAATLVGHRRALRAAGIDASLYLALMREAVALGVQRGSLDAAQAAAVRAALQEDARG
jgi:predicted short-subunit dehydrogenase-like oxidoreductase (DUF2520 family)